MIQRKDGHSRGYVFTQWSRNYCSSQFYRIGSFDEQQLHSHSLKSLPLCRLNVNLTDPKDKCEHGLCVRVNATELVANSV